MAEDYREQQAVAEQAAGEAGRILANAFGTVAAREKRPGDLVTDADTASQRAIADHLAQAFPGHTLLAEEDDVQPDPDNPWRWIVDPLDGTINFAHGLPLWAVSIALEHRGELVVGVIHLPLLGQTYSASRGAGAACNGQPIQVSRVDRLEAALIATGFPVDFAADANRQLAYFRRLSTRTHSIRRTGTSAWNLALVAAGACDLCYSTALHPWDAAAGVVLVREAGGMVTGLAGQPYDLYQLHLLASNGSLHPLAVTALAEAWPGT